ncbi:uncharacterized protein LOC134097590 isoform X3 [Sardina pilchardus]|uniref:uncharacterized protein LOC134097590 isoform X3 n=1 Tax=Sardina pilchardus TaxID=27697 RepID=UPI002E147240
MKKPVRIFVTQSGNTLNSHLDFLKRLRNHRKFKEKVVDECDVILAFCPIVSRVGTDIEAALKIFKGLSTAPKPIIVVVLHHTYEKDEVVPDSNKYASEKICIVNCLFHETEGLLKCKRNSDSIILTSKKLKEFKKKTSRNRVDVKPQEENMDGNHEKKKGNKKTSKNRVDVKPQEENMDGNHEKKKGKKKTSKKRVDVKPQEENMDGNHGKKKGKKEENMDGNHGKKKTKKSGESEKPKTGHQEVGSNSHQNTKDSSQRSCLIL